MKKLRNLCFALRDESGIAKYVLLGSLVVLLISAINLSGLVVNLNYPLLFYPIFWIVWTVICLSSSAPVFRSTMKVAWGVLVLAVLLSLLERALLNSWSTDRKYVIMQDLTLLAFAPIGFPSGMIPELIGEAIQLLPFAGDGFIHRLEISHGLGVFVVLTWAKYCCASLLETWAILTIGDRIRRARQRGKMQ